MTEPSQSWAQYDLIDLGFLKEHPSTPLSPISWDGFARLTNDCADLQRDLMTVTSALTEYDALARCPDLSASDLTSAHDALFHAAKAVQGLVIYMSEYPDGPLEPSPEVLALNAFIGDLVTEVAVAQAEVAQ